MILINIMQSINPRINENDENVNVYSETLKYILLKTICPMKSVTIL